MKVAELTELVEHKYGLRFTPQPAAAAGRLILKSPGSRQIFAILEPAPIPRMDLKCNQFAVTIQKLPGFAASFYAHNDNWVCVNLDQTKRRDVENVLDYAFKLSLTAKQSPFSQQFIYLPPQHVDTKYQAQTIRPRGSYPGHHLQKDVPAPIRKMLESYDYSILPARGRAKNFCRQGRLMADYRDHYEQAVPFRRYYPTYHDMNVAQLRTYFTWRTKIFAGRFEKTDPSYAYVYLYELLNGVGVADPADGYRKLTVFKHHYAEKYDRRMVAYLDRWLQDYVLFYDLDRKTVQTVFREEISTDKNYHILLHPTEYSADDLLAVFQKLATYLDHCRLFQQNPRKFAGVLRYVWQEVAALEQSRQVSFFSLYVAREEMTSHTFFASAVFDQRTAPQKREYILDSERRYQIEGTKYFCTALQPRSTQRVSLNNFLHETDRLLRQCLSLGRPLKPRGNLSKIFLQAIQTGIKKYQQAEETARRPKVEINLDDLAQIRADASITQESLLTDEERQAEDSSLPAEAPERPQQPRHEEQQVSQSPAAGSAAGQQTVAGLSAAETFFLHALLNNDPWKEYLKAHHQMPSILADQINDKLFDEIGDTVIEFNADDQPEIIADYRSDLEKLFKE